jgi:pyruvate carboxylase
MRRALTEYRIIGIKTTLPLHIQIMNSTRYQGGQFDTSFLEQHFTLDESLRPDQVKVAAIAATPVFLNNISPWMSRCAPTR